MLLNGPAARLGMPGDKVVVLTYGAYSEEEARSFQPIVVRVDGQNRQLKKLNHLQRGGDRPPLSRN